MSYNTLAESGMTGADPQTHLDIAQQYLDALYGAQYIGVLVSTDVTVQPNLWPRMSSTDTALTDSYGRPISDTEIPTAIKLAEIAAAKLSQSGNSLLPNTVADATTASTQNREVIEITKELQGMKDTQKWSPSSTSTSSSSTQVLSDGGLPIIAEVAALIAPVLSKSSGSNYYMDRF